MSRVLADRFVLDRELGAGGMARVFLGHDEVLERSVAVKVLGPGEGDAEMGERFRREGQTAARLSHPNIVQVYDAGEGDFEGERVSYIVMEYVPGGDLKELIDERGSLAGGDLARLGAGVCAGLSHAHERGVVHRDLKPHNILLDETGRPKLADFGIARALDVQGVTQPGYYLGTALYSSPEQLRGGGVTPKSDVYSLGATLYQAATGRTPFGGTLAEVAAKQVSEYPISPGAYSPGLDEDLGALIMDCLEKDPARRPDAETLERELSAAGSSAGSETSAAGSTPTRRIPASPAPESRPQSASRSASRGRRLESGTVRARAAGRRSPVLVAAAVAFLLVLGAGTVFTLLNADATSGVADLQPPRQDDGTPPADGSGPDGDQSSEPAQQASSAQPSGDAGNDPGDSAGEPSDATASGADGDSGSSPAGSQDGSQGGSGGDSPGQQPVASRGEELSGGAAVRTVRQLYSTAASGDYGESYSLLSRGFRQRNAPTQEQWSRQFGTLERITFLEGPSARVSGNTATVTGVTVAEHTDRTERNTVSWRLVNEGGEWRLLSLNLVDQRTLRT